jgi:hypothetical protein
MVAGGFMATAHQGTFPGFQFPNTTQIPNQVFDTLMPHLSGGELKVLLYICRRTFGFRKDSDSISLTQIAHGITTKAGRALDQGTGLSKRQVQRALRVLEGHRVILVERKVDETGLHEINTYRLNVLSSEKMSPPVETPVSGEVGTPVTPGVETPASTTKQREQKKVRQKKDSVVVAQELENFGIAQSAATRLIQCYPTQYIREKLEMAKGLVTARSSLVSQNPAGWLRCAIEENYCLPRNAEKHQQRSGKVARTEPKKQHVPKEEPQPTQTVPTEQREPENPSRENETVWQKALEQVKATLPASDAGETETRLEGTTLLQVTETAARIGVPTPTALAWLERRMYRQIAKAIKGVVGKELDLQFVPAS